MNWSRVDVFYSQSVTDTKVELPLLVQFSDQCVTDQYVVVCTYVYGIMECKSNDSNNRKNSCIVTVHREYKGATEIFYLKKRGWGSMGNVFRK